MVSTEPVAAQSVRTDARFEALNAKVDAINGSLSARIEDVNTSLSAKIDRAREEAAAGDAALSAKMDKLTEKVLEVQGHLKAVLSVLSLYGIVAASISIARSLQWC